MLSRVVVPLLLAASLAPPAMAARTVVLRDTIGADSSASDGQAGASSENEGDFGGHPGSIFVASDSGTLEEAKFVIFVEDNLNQPVNDAARLKSELPLTFNFWKDGLLGSGDTFEANPFGDEVSGHTHIFVNDLNFELGLVTIEPFGETGPPLDPARYTTFLVTVDLSSFGIQVTHGQEYVFNLIKDIDDNESPTSLELRQSGSAVNLSFEDVWFASNALNISPGYVQTQHGASYHNFASSISLLALEGDYNNDGTVNAADYTVWRDNYGATGNDPYNLGDGDGDGDTDGADFLTWQRQFGMTLDDLASSPASSLAVPEPTTTVLLLLGSAAFALLRFRRREVLAAI